MEPPRQVEVINLLGFHPKPRRCAKPSHKSQPCIRSATAWWRAKCQGKARQRGAARDGVAEFDSGLEKRFYPGNTFGVVTDSEKSGADGPARLISNEVLNLLLQQRNLVNT